MQANAGDQDRRHRHQGDEMTGAAQPRADHRAFVLAEQLFYAPERDRIDVPGVARNVGHMLDRAVVRRVEAVIHARGEAERDIAAVPVGLDQRRVIQQIPQRIGKTLGLQRIGAVEAPAGADDAVAGARKHVRGGVDTPRTGLQLAGEAGVQALEALLLRIPKVEIGKQAPDRDRRASDQRTLDPAEPAEEARREPARNAIGQQEVDVFVLQDLREFGTKRHLRTKEARENR